MRLISVAAFLAAIGFIAPADAGSCVRNRSVFCNRVTYTAPYAAPVVTYANAVRVIEVPTSLDYYHSLGSFYQANLVADAVVGRLTLLNQQSLPAKPDQQRPPAQVKPPATSPSSSGAVGRDEPDARLAKVVGDSCIRCHSGAKLGGGLDLSNLASIPELQRYKISAWVLDGTMPKGGEALPDADAKLFLDWAHSFKVASR
jgi:hypothetical protein